MWMRFIFVDFYLGVDGIYEGGGWSENGWRPIHSLYHYTNTQSKENTQHFLKLYEQEVEIPAIKGLFNKVSVPSLHAGFR
jgi:hypothetical protein